MKCDIHECLNWYIDANHFCAYYTDVSKCSMLKKSICSKIIGVINDWADNNEIETSPEMDVELAKSIYDQLF